MTDDHVVCSAIAGITVIVAALVLTRQAGDYLVMAALTVLGALGGLSGGVLAANGKINKPPPPI